eukprot:TRINITY_DN59318_c0_g1_i1.p1 TRINITY_DN59318_c0_g1~~TRINITY_DN59318_c0_g1_i1.p1  ORF type:complete len:541 (-),score=88.94 TRINITY_DN59318_c0_g1_i1:90-1712(-)
MGNAIPLEEIKNCVDQPSVKHDILDEDLLAEQDTGALAESRLKSDLYSSREGPFNEGLSIPEAHNLASPRVAWQLVALPRGPVRHSVPSYSRSTDASLLEGEIFVGEVAQLKVGERIQRVSLAIYENGFCVSQSSSSSDLGAEKAFSRLWCPFTLVEPCVVQAKRQDQPMSVFKLAVLQPNEADIFYYFACLGDKAETEVAEWLERIGDAINRVVGHMIPRRVVEVRPVPGRPGTGSRLMAGYLMLLVTEQTVARYFCELQAYQNKTARFVLYQDEWCEHEVRNEAITDASVVSTRKGTNCTIFGVDSLLLSARTWMEKELWLRAVSNIKVKLMFNAPAPTEEELNIFRGSVLERAWEVQVPDISEDDVKAPVPEPSLDALKGRPPIEVVGDEGEPDPITSYPPSREMTPRLMPASGIAPQCPDLSELHGPASIDISSVFNPPPQPLPLDPYLQPGAGSPSHCDLDDMLDVPFKPQASPLEKEALYPKAKRGAPHNLRTITQPLEPLDNMVASLPAKPLSDIDALLPRTPEELEPETVRM